MIVEFENYHLSFQEKEVLSAFSLRLDEGKIHCLIGKNGAGKTQILNAISNLLASDSKSEGSVKAPSKVGFAFQKPELVPWLTIFQNLQLIAPEKTNEIDSLLKQFGLSSYSNHYPNQISGGSQQKINIIRAFLSDASLILMDEPFHGLDLPQKEDLITMIVKLWNHQKTILFVTHDIDEALVLSHEIFFLSKQKRNIERKWQIAISLPRKTEELRKTQSTLQIFEEISTALRTDSHE